MGVLRDAIDADARETSGSAGELGVPAAASSTAAAGAASNAGAGAPMSGAGADHRSQLRRRRDALAEQVIEMHWDLGGLAYEMAIRDHFRLDVLVRRAALLQERDSELAEIERLLAMEESGSIGDCPDCGAPHSRGAVFCWQCGMALMERSSGPASDTEGSTAVMDALLTPGVAPHRELVAPPADLDESGSGGASADG
jgi:hypothetical protein